MCVCGIYVLVEDPNIFKRYIVFEWLTSVVELFGIILVGRPIWTQFDDFVVLAVEVLVIVFFPLLSCSIGFLICSLTELKLEHKLKRSCHMCKNDDS